MPKEAPFTPDWVSPPGDTIAAILEERGVTPVTLASKLKRTHEDIAALLEGRAVLTDDFATRLAALFGPSPSFWTKRESQYRADVLRLTQFASTEEAKSWLGEISGKELVRLGWIQPFEGKAGIAAACLQFFGVLNVLGWRAAYRDTLQAIAFRTSKAFVSQPGAVAAWLRQGEIRASDIDCKPWNPDAFRAALQEIRALTRIEDPNKFLPELVRRCAESGVAVVVLRAPKECKASGASRFLTESKAMLLLSVRHLSDDHFWFTFFHEAGHLILHGHKFLFVDGLGCDDKLASSDEDKANRFAEELLIPPAHRPEFLGLRADKRAVMRFAVKIGISRGLVVGQLQHHKLIERDQLNGLKNRFRWVND